jgi:uncharacterized repeat protein (TIGR03803 family)
MLALDRGRYALSIGAAAAFLAACGGSQQPIGAPGAMPHSLVFEPAHTTAHRRPTASSYGVLYSFPAHAGHGIYPVAGLIDVDGVLYGTTQSGGTYDKKGTVFSVSEAGDERVLHSFGNGDDGAVPMANAIDVSGTLYGTTEWGGRGTCQNGPFYSGCGTVYRISTTGKEKVLYSFAGDPDGAHPTAGLINLNGTFYGTTAKGGAYDLGTVYSVSTSGAEKVLYSFSGRDGDGRTPMAALINVNGTLYGTTLSGGKNRYGQPGTVFSISTSGKERVLYRFRGEYDDDGAAPQASLINVKGVLYGTTSSGGQYITGGTVFSISKAGKEHVLHSFGNGSDGKYPQASLIDVNGTLYGTTVSGGKYGSGTVFSISTSGTERVLHDFGSGSDGTGPYASLIDANGTLYGTTRGGGSGGHGTVFAFSP